MGFKRARSFETRSESIKTILFDSKILISELLLAKIGFDTAKNGPPKEASNRDL